MNEAGAYSDTLPGFFVASLQRIASCGNIYVMSSTEQIKLSDLIPDSHNANKGTERGRALLSLGFSVDAAQFSTAHKRAAFGYAFCWREFCFANYAKSIVRYLCSVVSIIMAWITKSLPIRYIVSQIREIFPVLYMMCSQSPPALIAYLTSEIIPFHHTSSPVFIFISGICFFAFISITLVSWVIFTSLKLRGGQPFRVARSPLNTAQKSLSGLLVIPLLNCTFSTRDRLPDFRAMLRAIFFLRGLIAPKVRGTNWANSCIIHVGNYTTTE